MDNIILQNKMSITDTIFSCSETPVWTPQTLDPTTLHPCLSCTLRLSSKLPGAGSCSPNEWGLHVDENPTTEFVVNGSRYNLVGGYLCFPGVHRLYGNQTVCDAEYVIQFRHVSEPGKYATLSVPLTKSTNGNPYFHTLGQVTRNRPVLATVLSPDSKVLSYPGPSLNGRTAKDPRPSICSPISYPTTWYVLLTPSTISNSDYDRLHGLCDELIGPPKPLADITANRATRLLTLITGITLELNSTSSDEDGAKSTSALKCYRIDPEEDIRNNKVYVNGKKWSKGNTLQKELQNAANLTGDTPDDGTIQPGDIEGIIGIILGVLLGVILCAAIAYGIWRGTFSHYLAVLKLYATPGVGKMPTP